MLPVLVTALARILWHVLAVKLVVLALQRVAALHAVALCLVELERLVHQSLLLLHQLAELVHLLAHGVVLLAHLLLAAARLQVVHHSLKLGQHLTGLIARA
ncbi:hypothetical protein D9M72_634480 [compost metagenome]